MSGEQLAAQVLLWIGVASEVVCCVGVLWMRDVFDRLHYASAGSGLPPLLIGAAVALAGVGTASGTVEATTAGAVVVLAGPVVTHATARAARQLRVGAVGADRGPGGAAS